MSKSNFREAKAEIIYRTVVRPALCSMGHRHGQRRKAKKETVHVKKDEGHVLSIYGAKKNVRCTSTRKETERKTENQKRRGMSKYNSINQINFVFNNMNVSCNSGMIVNKFDPLYLIL